MLGNKCGCAQQAELFAVREKKNNVISRRRPRGKRPRGLQQSGHARRVISRARRRGHGVVVRREQQGQTGGAIRSAVAARHQRHDVFDSGGDAVGGKNARGLLNRGLESQRPQLRHQVVPHTRVLRGAHRMRRARNFPHVLHGALRGKFRGGRRGGHHAPRLLQPDRPGGEQHNPENPGGAHPQARAVRAHGCIPGPAKSGAKRSRTRAASSGPPWPRKMVFAPASSSLRILRRSSGRSSAK